MYDSHAHVISDDPVSFPAANPDEPEVAAFLASPFPATQLLRQMDECEVGKALVVQRGQIYAFDNRYVLAASAESGGRLKAVCGVNAQAEDCGSTVRQLQTAGAGGVRLMARMGAPDFAWLDGPASAGFWQASADLGLPVCVHFFSRNRDEGLARLDGLLDRYPVRDLVIDHLANGPIASSTDCGIDDALRRISERVNVSIKFTAIPLNDLASRGIDAGSVLAAHAALFGTERLVWGSDVTQSKGTYAEITASGRAAVAGFTDEDQERMLQGNVARIYGL